MKIHARSPLAGDARRPTPSDAGLGLAAEEIEFLVRRGFDPARFEELSERIRRGELTEASAVYRGRLEVPRPEDVPDLPPPGSAAASELARRGEEAFRNGEAAVVVLAGGMATRFGGGVKGAVDVLPGRSFIREKLDDARAVGRRHGVEVPFCIMTSFATKDGIVRHLEERRLDGPDIHVFEQGASIRMTPDGEIFRGADGKPSYYAPGHGDFFDALRESGLRDELARRGIRYLYFSNVDNLGATLDARIIGYHAERGVDMTAELAANLGRDKAGCAVRAEGRLRLMEGFRLPPDAPQFPDLSLNSFVFTLKALAQEIPLTSHLVTKKVEGRPALQVERITCEATEAVDASGRPLLSLACIRVPRSGGPTSFFDGRFYPVKEPADLDEVRRHLAATREAERAGAPAGAGR
jgi:UTP--glucose-1-phosphate uridylyltransferase